MNNFDFMKILILFFCLFSGFPEGERIVIEARQRRRIEEERQQMANNQVTSSSAAICLL